MKCPQVWRAGLGEPDSRPVSREPSYIHPGGDEISPGHQLRKAGHVRVWTAMLKGLISLRVCVSG